MKKNEETLHKKIAKESECMRYVAIGGVLILLVSIALYYFHSSNTVSVSSKHAEVMNGYYDEYYLYVPNDNGKSTCTWSYIDENGKPATFTSYPDTKLNKTGEHDFIYGDQTKRYTHVTVECLNSTDGSKYTGVF